MITLQPTRSTHSYYHFIVDLLLPLSTVIKNTPDDCIFVIQEFGILTNLLTQIFPGRIKIEERDNKLRYTEEVNLNGMSPKYFYLTRNLMEDFALTVCNNLNIESTNESNKVLLIERAVFVADPTIPKPTGSLTRSILNHKDLESTLYSMVKHPFELHNLQLENLSFKEQIECFKQAKVVIGQHGAGLVNCIWMEPQSIVIELGPRFRVEGGSCADHYQIISKLKNFSYYWYEVHGNHAEINIEHFKNWILEQIELREFFGC
ncbi:MAG: glycosyltransferase 61 family protein [Cyanobacteriota bacterium]